jgi:hypothetical protein
MMTLLESSKGAVQCFRRLVKALSGVVNLYQAQAAFNAAFSRTLEKPVHA